MTHSASALAPQGPGPMPLSASLVAAAIVAAAKAYGDDPMAAYGPGAAQQRRASTAAAVALCGHTGQGARTVCGLLKVHPTSFSRAASQRSVSFVAALDAAMAALGEICPPHAPPITEAARMPGPLTAPVVMRPHTPSQASPALKAAEAVVRQLPPPSPVRRARATRPDHVARSSSVRMREVTGRRLRYCKRFLEANWPLEDVAWLFDVSPDALALATRGVSA